MKALLIRQECWDIVCGVTKEPTTEDVQLGHREGDGFNYTKYNACTKNFNPKINKW